MWHFLFTFACFMVMSITLYDSDTHIGTKKYWIIWFCMLAFGFSCLIKGMSLN